MEKEKEKEWSSKNLEPGRQRAQMKTMEKKKKKRKKRKVLSEGFFEAISTSRCGREERKDGGVQWKRTSNRNI